MRLTRAIYDELVAHARREAPLECCGLISAHGEDAIRVYPITNAAGSEYRYALDGAEHYTAAADIEACGLRVGAIYHSHTHAPPTPSPSDIALAVHPDLLYVIIGADSGVVRAFTIAGGIASESALAIVAG